MTPYECSICGALLGGTDVLWYHRPKITGNTDGTGACGKCVTRIRAQCNGREERKAQKESKKRAQLERAEALSQG